MRYRVGPRESCVSNVYCFSRRSHCSVSAAPPADNTTHRTHKQGTSDGTRHRFAVARSRHTIPQEHSRPVSPGRATPLALGQVSPVESILCRLVPASRTCPIPPPGIPAIFSHTQCARHIRSDRSRSGRDRARAAGPILHVGAPLVNVPYGRCHDYTRALCPILIPPDASSNWPLAMALDQACRSSIAGGGLGVFCFDLFCISMIPSTATTELHGLPRPPPCDAASSALRSSFFCL